MNGGNKTYQYFLFDMDGVVVDSMEHHARTWIEVFNEIGIVLTREDIFRREGMSGLSSIRDIFNEKGIAVPSDPELLKLQEKKLSLFEKCVISVYPEIPKILSYLKNKNLTMALVTGSLRRSVNHVLTEELSRFFTAIITVDDISNGKPHPEPYLKAISTLGADAQSSLVIENAPLGIISAKNAGCDCYAVKTTLDSDYLSSADLIFPDHASLYRRLQSVIENA